LLLAPEGQLLRAAGPLPAPQELPDEVAAWIEADRGPRTAHNNEYITALAQVNGTNWTVLLREPWHDLTTPLVRFEQAMPFVLFIAAAVSFLTLYFGLRLVVRPLRILAEQTQQIGEGNFEAASEAVGGVEEIERLRLAVHEMAQQIQTYQRGLERHLHAVTRAQEEERARLARELHDETIQGLIALDHRLQKAKRAIARNPGTYNEEIAALREMTGNAINEVRRFSRALRPLYLEDLGLCPALEMLAAEASVGYRVSGEPRRLPADTELVFYRIAQESINNARRHAHAAQVELHLEFAPEAVTLSVQDNGVGFDLPANLSHLTQQGHFGLVGVQERAQLINAHLELASAPGQGTSITVTAST
jgi:signal transduction histidine kinase